jgi:endonuclease-3
MVHTGDIQWVAEQLIAAFGEPVPPPSRPVLDGLIGTILSQNTTGLTAGLAYTELRRRFPDWAQLPEAETAGVADAIRVAGLAETRARRLQSVILSVTDDFGEASLESLREWTDEQVTRYLTGLEGVGPKTAACVLLFAMGRDVFPVDTHVWRIVRRLGWVTDSSTRDQTFEQLGPRVPPELRHSLHVLLIRLGREICRAGRPRCGGCPLAERCLGAFSDS